MDYESIKSYFNVKHQDKNKCMAICPCHNDKRASLSISYDENKRMTLIYCHAGCDAKDILDRAGLRIRDLYEDERHKESSKVKIEAVYRYTDSQGALLFEKIRFRPKSFTQRRYVEGAVVWGLGAGRYNETYPGSNEFSMKERNGARAREFPETQPVLYNLPGVVKGVKEKETVYIVEGEKDADNLIKHGLIATTNFDGASISGSRQKWRKEYNDYLKGADVVLIPDNDNPGRCHMMNIAKELKGVAKNVKIVDLPVPHKEDVSFYLEEGNTIDELLNLVRNTVHGGDHIKGENFSLLNYHFSDVGNAERLIALYGSDIRYSHPLDKFFIWSGRHWQVDGTGCIYKMAKTTLRRLLAEGEALDDSSDDGARGDIAKLQGKRFVVSSELNDGQVFDENLLKCVTGGESIPVRFLYGEEFNLKPEFKIWMGTNEKPRIKGTDLGIWRRVRMIPFLYTFTSDERDKNFMEKFIMPELPGILNWAVEGCMKWQSGGMEIPEAALAALEEYKDEMDVVQRFLDERCIQGEIYTIKVGDLYQRFSAWCSKSGDRTMSSVKFCKKLKEKGFLQYKSNGWRHWKGIGALKFS